MENDAVKADLAADASFYDKYLAEDWTGGTSRGTWDSKQSIASDMKDAKNNKTNSESISDLEGPRSRRCRDCHLQEHLRFVDQGQHYARTVLSTDTFLRENGAWKQLAGHSSQEAK